MTYGEREVFGPTRRERGVMTMKKKKKRRRRLIDGAMPPFFCAGGPISSSLPSSNEKRLLSLGGHVSHLASDVAREKQKPRKEATKFEFSSTG